MCFHSSTNCPFIIHWLSTHYPLSIHCLPINYPLIYGCRSVFRRWILNIYSTKSCGSVWLDFESIKYPWIIHQLSMNDPCIIYQLPINHPSTIHWLFIKIYPSVNACKYHERISIYIYISLYKVSIPRLRSGIPVLGVPLERPRRPVVCWEPGSLQSASGARCDGFSDGMCEGWFHMLSSCFMWPLYGWLCSNRFIYMYTHIYTNIFTYLDLYIYIYIYTNILYIYI